MKHNSSFQGKIGFMVNKKVNTNFSSVTLSCMSDALHVNPPLRPPQLFSSLHQQRISFLAVDINLEVQSHPLWAYFLWILGCNTVSLTVGQQSHMSYQRQQFFNFTSKETHFSVYIKSVLLLVMHSLTMSHRLLCLAWMPLNDHCWSVCEYYNFCSDSQLRTYQIRIL